MATNTSGGVSKATANTVTAMKRSAESRTCSDCGRKSATVWHHGEFVSVRYCRWSRDGRCAFTLVEALRRRVDRGFTLQEEARRTGQRWRYELADAVRLTESVSP